MDKPDTYYDLFQFFLAEHGIILTESEIQEIIHEVQNHLKKENESINN